MSDAWTPEMVQRLYALTEAKTSAAVAAQILNREFGQAFTRNSVLGRLFRDRKSGKDVPKGAEVGTKAPKVKPAKPIKPFKKSIARQFDEADLRALDMRKRGKSWGDLAKYMRTPMDSVMARLRGIALDDLHHGDFTVTLSEADWKHILEA